MSEETQHTTENEGSENPESGGDWDESQGSFEDYLDQLGSDSESSENETETSENRSNEKKEGSEVDESKEQKEADQEKKAQEKKAQEKEGSEAKQPEKIKIKTKVNGEEIEEELSIEEIQRGLQKAKGSEQKFYEAAKMRKEAEQAYKFLKENPAAVLEKLGLNVDELAENRIAEKIRLESMTPEQREAYEAKQKLEQYERQRLQQEQQQKQQYLKAETERALKEINGEIVEAINESQMKKSPELVARIAGLLKANIKAGRKYNAKDIVERINQQDERNIREKVSAMDGQKLVEFLGKDTAEKIRAHLMNDYKEQTRKGSQPKKHVSNKSKESGKMTMEELDTYIENL